jgi:hypothetical protein
LCHERSLLCWSKCTHLPTMSGKCDITQIRWKCSIICSSGCFFIWIRVGKVVRQLSRPHVHVACLIWTILHLQAIKVTSYKLTLKKTKAIPTTGREDLLGCNILRIPYCTDNQITDGGEVDSLMHWPCSTPQKHLYFYPWYSFLLQAE